MNILICGNIKIIARSLAASLLERNHHVVVTGVAEGFLGLKNRNLIEYRASASDDLYTEIFRSHSFDLVIYNDVDESQIIFQAEDGQSRHSHNGLDTVLALCARTDVEEFILISSTRVYGNDQSGIEDEDPEPDSAYGQKLLNDENLVKFYSKTNRFSAKIVRTAFIFGPEEENSFIGQLIRHASRHRKVKLTVDRDDSCQFTHIRDFLQFLNRLIESDVKNTGQLFNLSTDNVNFDFVEQLVNKCLSKTALTFSSSRRKKKQPQKIGTEKARKKFGWKPQFHLADEMSLLIDEMAKDKKPENPLLLYARSLINSLHPFLAWIEVILGAFLMHLVTIWTDTIIVFKYIDYRLLFVVIIGSTHGLLFGVLASLLAMLSAAFRWVSIGLDWALLVYNIENWIPFALYFLAGSVTGYVHDKSTNEIIFERNQTRLIHEKYEFLYHLYNEISNIKDRLREQLVGYRDSFGRFFRIANELNELEEDNVFLKALEVLEDLMKIDQIAIYTAEKTGTYGRLEVKSSNLKRQIPKSILLSDFSIALDQLHTGDIFQNKELLANYPAYIAPIIDRGKLIGLIILWDVKFEQFTLYYSNLFKVITGLIQSALVRAAIFKNAQLDELYLASTKVLKPEAFVQALELKKKMKRNRIADFLAVSIQKEDMSWKELYGKLRKGIRDDDVVGLLDEKDDHCYVLLSNAGIENIEIINKRLSELGLKSVYLEDIESD